MKTVDVLFLMMWMNNMALPRNYKPKVTKKLLELKAQLYDIIDSISADDTRVILKFKKGWSGMDGSNYMFAPTATELLRNFKFKKAGT